MADLPAYPTPNPVQLGVNRVGVPYYAPPPAGPQYTRNGMVPPAPAAGMVAPPAARAASALTVAKTAGGSWWPWGGQAKLPSDPLSTDPARENPPPPSPANSTFLIPNYNAQFGDPNQTQVSVPSANGGKANITIARGQGGPQQGNGAMSAPGILNRMPTKDEYARLMTTAGIAHRGLMALGPMIYNTPQELAASRYMGLGEATAGTPQTPAEAAANAALQRTYMNTMNPMAGLQGQLYSGGFGPGMVNPNIPYDIGQPTTP